MPTPRSNKNEESEDLGEILREKLKEHKRAFSTHEKEYLYHRQQADFHKERVKYIEGVLGGLPEKNTSLADLSEGDDKYIRPWYWKRIAVPLIARVFGNGEFRTSDLMEAGAPPELEDPALRKKYIYAVSVALSELVEEGIVVAQRKDGVKGYMYKLKNKIVVSPMPPSL